MRSVQEREQSGDAASESGFFEKGHPLALDAAVHPAANHPADNSLAANNLAANNLAANSLAANNLAANNLAASIVVPVPAIAHEGDGHADGAGADAAVLQAFGEVRNLNAELQRANDALHIVNETLRGKMDLLRTTALDLEQMLDGVELGVLLLDEELAVRHFNDMAAHFLGLSSHDVGGSISASCRGFGPRLVEWCREVLRSGRRIRRTFQSAIGEPLTLHVRRTRVDGEPRLILIFAETA